MPFIEIMLIVENVSLFFVVFRSDIVMNLRNIMIFVFVYKLWKGNVFTPVCDSVHGGMYLPSLGRHLPR